MKDLIEQAVQKFNAKAQSDEKLRKDLDGIERRIVIDCRDGAKYNFALRDHQIGPVSEGLLDGAEVTIVSDTATLTALLRKEMGPMKAYATGKLKIKASLEDVLRLRKLF